jgi:cytoskeletal protein CcmA (bactofilin family)
MKKLINLLTFLGLFIIFSSSTYAAYSHQNTIFLPKGQTIEESYVVSGNTIKIDGNINGDLYCAGQDIEINGNVSGDILCAGQMLKINGIVTGNVRVAGQSIDINGEVGRNTDAFGQRVNINNNSKLNGELYFAGETIYLNGMVAKKVWGAGNNVSLFGSFNNDVNIHATNLSQNNSAKILGKVYFTKIVKNSGNTNINKNTNIVAKNRMMNNNGMPGIFGGIASFLIGLLVIFIMRKNIEKSIAMMEEKKMASIGWGILYLILTPLALITLMITIIGIPFAILLFLVWMVSFMFAYIYFAVYVGRTIILKYWTDKKDSLVLALLIGIVINSLLSMIPVLGGIYNFVILVWGLGGMALAFKTNPEVKEKVKVKAKVKAKARSKK